MKGEIRLLPVLFFAAVVGIGGSILPSKFAITFTDSLDRRFFLVYRGNENIRKGDYVLFPYSIVRDQLEKKYRVRFPFSADYVVKKVVCAPGEFLESDGMKYYCDGVFLGYAKERSRTGVPTERFVYRGMVPEGKIFVMGTSPDSYDSRYFGFLDRSVVVGKAYPVF
jgi:signal peptidase I